jgi:hypothetical protein
MSTEIRKEYYFNTKTKAFKALFECIKSNEMSIICFSEKGSDRQHVIRYESFIPEFFMDVSFWR